MNDDDPRGYKESLAIGTVVLAAAVLLIIPGLIILPAILGRENGGRRASSQNNMKQMGIVYKMYANESAGEVYPPLAFEPGLLMPEFAKIYPEYFSDPLALVAPKHPHYKELQDDPNLNQRLREIGDGSYWYLGYAIPDEKTGLAFIAAYWNAVVSGEPLDWDRDLETPSGTIYRLTDRIENALAPPGASSRDTAILASRIPVMIENINLRGDGANVAFLDGHVAYMPYPGEFPMTRPFIEGLRGLDALEDISQP